MVPFLCEVLWQCLNLLRMTLGSIYPIRYKFFITFLLRPIKINMILIIFIHPNSAAGALRLQERRFPVVFVFIQPNEDIPMELVKDKRILILDLDMGDKLIEIIDVAKCVLLSDHHDSTPITLHKHADVI